MDGPPERHHDLICINSHRLRRVGSLICTVSMVETEDVADSVSDGVTESARMPGPWCKTVMSGTPYLGRHRPGTGCCLVNDEY